MSRYRFVPPEDGQLGAVWDGDAAVTAEYMTPAQAKSRTLFWQRKLEIHLLEKLRAEMRAPEMHSAERGA